MKNDPKVKEMFGVCGCGKMTEGSAGVLCCAEDWKAFKENCIEEIDDYSLNRVKRLAKSEIYIITNSYLELEESRKYFKFCATVAVCKESNILLVEAMLFADFREFLKKNENAYWHFCAVLEKITQGFGSKSSIFKIDFNITHPQLFKAKVFPYERTIKSVICDSVVIHNAKKRIVRGKSILFLSRKGVINTFKKICQKRKEQLDEL